MASALLPFTGIEEISINNKESCMLRNYFSLMLRHLWKNKSYTLLNIMGLAIGIACAGLIMLWVENELQYNRHNTKRDRLYAVLENQQYDTYVFTHWSTPGIMGPAMQSEIAGIANTCRTSEGGTALLFGSGEKAVFASGKYADSSVFDMFTLPFVEGNAKNVFAQLHSLVITERTAKKIFGQTRNVVGKTIQVDNSEEYVITGVLKDLPKASTFTFEWLSPFEVYLQKSPWAKQWVSNCVNTYVELKEGVDASKVNQQLNGYIKGKAPESISRPFLHNINNWYLRGEFVNGQATGSGRILYVKLFSIIAGIILFIACINFMNLATARSEKRAKEVGVRKVLGAEKKRLVMQFMGEAIFMALLGTLAALCLMLIILPYFNTLVGKQLSPNPGNPLHLTVLLLITLICGITAGSYPSLYLSSFNPIRVFKGIRLQTGSAGNIRKGLVVLQFSVSIILIICTIIIYQQLEHVKDRSLGFNKNNLIEVDVHGDMAQHFAVIKQDLLNTGLIENAALTDHATLYYGNNTDALSWQGKTPGSKILVSGRGVTPEFFGTTGMKILEGRGLQLSDSVTTEGNTRKMNIVITKSLADMMGGGSAIGKILWNEGDKGTLLTVTGVVNDYVYGNMYGKPDPVLFTIVPDPVITLMYIRTESGNPEKTVEAIASVVKKHNPNYPFVYRFVDDQFNALFAAEMLTSRLSRVFAALAIIISCLGLFGLAAYMAERRTKEIGIRKVLGASVNGVARLLSKDFLKLALISCCIATPLAWLVMHQWLQGFPYRTEIHWWVFLLAGAGALLITLLTVSFQAIKAALANPVNSLRSE